MPDELLTSTSPVALSDAGPPQLPTGHPAAPEAGLRPSSPPHPYDEPPPARPQARPSSPRAPPRGFHIDKRAGKLLVEMHDDDADELLTSRQVAVLWGVSKEWLMINRHKNCGPKYVQFGRAVRYRRADLRAWLAERTHQGTHEYVDPATSARISRQVRGE